MALLPNGRFRKTRRHYDLPNQAHELTISCYRRLALLDRDRTRQWFINAVDKARQEHNFAVWAYVIMPEHAHLLIHPRLPVYSVAAIEKTIKQSCARHAIAWLREHHPAWLETLRGALTKQGQRYHFWQPGGGYDRNVVEESTVWASIQYIHMNPVRRALVVKPEDWIWSSARAYSGFADAVMQVDLCPVICH